MPLNQPVPERKARFDASETHIVYWIIDHLSEKQLSSISDKFIPKIKQPYASERCFFVGAR